MARIVTLLSFRLGGTDGVAVEARKWSTALAALGFSVRRVAGELADGAGPDDIEIPELWAPRAQPGFQPDSESGAPLDSERLAATLDGSDLVIAENLCSLPIRPHASAAATAALSIAAAKGTRVLFRHHDLAWQRASTRSLGEQFPPRIDGALHTTINLRSRRELLARGYAPVVAVHNYFDLDAPLGDRARTRADFGFADDELVLLQPARAIERKNVPGAIRFVKALHDLAPSRKLRYWLTGPAEDGYQAMLEKVLARCPVPYSIGRAATAADAYAACDVVLFPSTWEGFGNPTIESVWARRPCVVTGYPVLGEIEACGLRFFNADEPTELVKHLINPNPRFLESNLHRARLSFSIDELPGAIESAFAAAGWLTW